MNFLEQLTAEYYAYRGWFVRTNVKFGRNARGRGGHEGEMDVLAFYPESATLLHIETSTDSDSWKEREVRFKRKFETANNHYRKIFRFEIKRIEKLAIVGFNQKQHTDFFKIAPIRSIPEFIGQVTDYVSQFDPQKDAIPENYPLLRAMQYATYYDRRYTGLH